MDNKSPWRIVTTTFGRLVIVSDDGGVVVWEKSRAVAAAGRHDSSDKYNTATFISKYGNSPENQLVCSEALKHSAVNTGNMKYLRNKLRQFIGPIQLSSHLY